MWDPPKQHVRLWLTIVAWGVMDLKAYIAKKATNVVTCYRWCSKSYFLRTDSMLIDLKPRVLEALALVLIPRKP